MEGEALRQGGEAGVDGVVQRGAQGVGVKRPPGSLRDDFLVDDHLRERNKAEKVRNNQWSCV